MDLKEVSFRPGTDPADIRRKVQAVMKFLADGEQVRLSVKFKGREFVHPQIGQFVLDMFVKECELVGVPQKQAVFEGKRLIVILNPRKRG